MKKLVIFASGKGSNAENIIDYFHANGHARVSAVFTNNAKAGVIEIAQKNNIDWLAFEKSELEEGIILKRLQAIKPDLIILAGFLLKFPEEIISDFRGRVINIHPALLPEFGGKGMYGMRVHRAVAESRAKQTGITIHFVDEHYDNGDVIFQKAIELNGETPEQIAEKVHELEQAYFPKIIEQILLAK